MSQKEEMRQTDAGQTTEWTAENHDPGERGDFPLPGDSREGLPKSGGRKPNRTRLLLLLLVAALLINGIAFLIVAAFITKPEDVSLHYSAEAHRQGEARRASREAEENRRYAQARAEQRLRNQRRAAEAEETNRSSRRESRQARAGLDMPGDIQPLPPREGKRIGDLYEYDCSESLLRLDTEKYGDPSAPEACPSGKARMEMVDHEASIYDAVEDCRNRGMRLPTFHELSAAGPYAEHLGLKEGNYWANARDVDEYRRNCLMPVGYCGTYNAPPSDDVKQWYRCVASEDDARAAKSPKGSKGRKGDAKKDEAAPGFLTITADENAQIYIDGMYVASRTPLRNHKLRAGKYGVRVYFLEARKFSRAFSVSIDSGKTATLHLSLHSEP